MTELVTHSAGAGLIPGKKGRGCGEEEKRIKGDYEMEGVCQGWGGRQVAAFCLVRLVQSNAKVSGAEQRRLSCLKTQVGLLVLSRQKSSERLDALISLTSPLGHPLT